MHSFIVRFAIICLLFLSRQRLAIAKAKNVSYQGTTPAKLFTKYLKVPWINLNSTWEIEVASSCRDDITTLFQSADAGEMWALQMLDAASKIPAGILIGNIRDLGMYEECTNVKGHHNPANIQGRHCMVSMSMPPKVVGDASEALYIQKQSAYNPTPDVLLNFAASVCLPSSCVVEDIVGLINASIQSTPELTKFEIGVARVTCSSVKGTSDNFTLGTILAISFFAVLAIFLIFCTVCDFMVKVRCGNGSLALKTLAKFSLHRNALGLLSTEIPPGIIPPIYGIKVLTMFFITMVHRLMSSLGKPLVNLSTLYDVRETWLGPFISISPYTVDTFFTISGFLTAYLFFKKIRSGKEFNVLEFYLHRYLRLAPCMAVVILFYIFILPQLGSGPIWETILTVTSDFCRKNWWANLLYIQNFVNREEMCMFHTWHLAVEMQLFWICPIIFYPLYYRPKLGLFGLSLVLIASLIAPAVHLLINKYSFLWDANGTFEEKYLEFINSYTITHNRALPYFMGILLGYYMAHNKRKLTKVQAAFNWILASILILFCFWNGRFIQPNATVYNAAWEAAYVSVGRLGWCLATSWIIYACTQGYGGLVTRILSLPIFVPLSRMTYGIYLVSVVVQLGTIATGHIAEFHSIFSVVYLALGDLVVSTVAAFVLNLCIEMPVATLEKILRAKTSSQIIKRPSLGKKEKLLAIVSQYSDSANCQDSSNLHIDTEMLDFWRAVSDVLNILGKPQTKIPSEWIKTWQDWRSNLSNKNGQRQINGNGSTDRLADVALESTRLKKELLIFLITVNYDLEDVASVGELDVAEYSASELGSSDSQTKDLAIQPDLRKRRVLQFE